MSDWRTVLAQTRAAARRGPGPVDMRRYWRGDAYREHDGAPEPVVRARGFARVLDRINLHVYPDERIAGSRVGFCLHERPARLAQASFAAALAAHDRRGQRNFQAGFDHAVPDYPTLLAAGISGIVRRARDSAGGHDVPLERAFLQAVQICMEALGRFAGRYAEAERAAGDESLATVLEHVSNAPPATFHQALQLVWLVHIAFVSEGRAHMALGRIDQYLLPFYRADLAAGRIDREGALDLLCHLWAHVAELGEVTNITVGGLQPDGRDATNELSVLCLEATRRVGSPHTNLSARLHQGSPEAFHRACYACIRTGIGFPALFNDHVLVPGLEAIGIPAKTARDYCLVGCIETHFPGCQQAWGDGVPGFAGESNIQCLDRALHRLADEPSPSYERLVALFREEIDAFFSDCARRVNTHIARFPPSRYPDPFLSALTADCIARARDINDGGARFARFYKCAGGENLATLADSMAAVRKLVFGEGRLSLRELVAALDSDFTDAEAVRLMLLRDAPKYGNDDALVDETAAEMLELILDAVDRLPPVHGGGRFVACAAGNIHNIARGRCVGATPDGRRAGTPLSDATSPHFGRDRKGPTAVLNSMAGTATSRILGGRVANMKFDPELLSGPGGAELFSSLTNAFVDFRIQELQFNVTGNELLEEAREHPEAHEDLVVRVSGFSAYFTRLSPEVQNDVIRRRAHARPGARTGAASVRG